MPPECPKRKICQTQDIRQTGKARKKAVSSPAICAKKPKMDDNTPLKSNIFYILRPALPVRTGQQRLKPYTICGLVIAEAFP
jgi:hypothetical protein